LNFDARFPTAHGDPLAPAKLKTLPQDFIVEETLAFPLSGQGEHLYLYIRKTNANTEWVSKQLARQLRVAPRDIGYAGLKDRHAVTSQWFSLPGKDISSDKLTALQIDGVEICKVEAHDRKLRKGAIKHNRFTICLRDISVESSLLQERLARIAQRGVPNYFDEQRFGRQRGNLLAAQRMFQRTLKPSRFQRGIYLSAARAWVFNQILARRISLHTWNSAMAGDVFWLDGTKRFFTPDTIDEDIRVRLAQGDIHPTGAMWGEGELQSHAEAAELEWAVANQWTVFAEGLIAARLTQDRRPLRVLPRQMSHSVASGSGTLTLSFALPAGSYATAVIRELVQTEPVQTDSLN
jgi:tRNA pseudouridine13 synthase